MGLVANASRFTDRKHAFVNATIDAIARVVEHARVHSSIVSLKPRGRGCDLGWRFGGRRWGVFGLARRAGLRPRPALGGLPQPVTGLPIAERRELCPKA